MRFNQAQVNGGTCFSDLHVLDTQTMEWSRPEQQCVTPETRAGHSGVTIGEYWFISGGGNSRKGVSDTLVLNMSTYEWSVVTGLEARAPPTSEGSSLVMHTINGEKFLVSFGGYSGRYSNQVYALKASLKSSVPFQQINEAGTNGIAPISPISEAANSSRKVIFEIEELQDKPGNKADTSKTAAQVVKGERNQIEDKLNQEQLQSLRLRQELANVERRNTELTEELHLVRDQISAEQERASKLEDEVSEIQERLQKMDALEKEFKLLRGEIDSGFDTAAASSNQPPRGVGFWRWNG